jgi:hypothetical protein
MSGAGVRPAIMPMEKITNLSPSEREEAAIRVGVLDGRIGNTAIEGVLPNVDESNVERYQLAQDVKRAYDYANAYLTNPSPMDTTYAVVTPEDVKLIKEYQDILHVTAGNTTLYGKDVITTGIEVDTDAKGQPVPRAQEFLNKLGGKTLRDVFPFMEQQQQALQINYAAGLSGGNVSAEIAAQMNPNQGLSSEAKQYLETHEGAKQAALATGAYGLSGEQVGQSLAGTFKPAAGVSQAQAAENVKQQNVLHIIADGVAKGVIEYDINNPYDTNILVKLKGIHLL